MWPSSCIQTAARAFREYRPTRSSILSMRAIWPGAPNMRKQLVPKHRNEPQLRPRGIASTVLCASLTAGVMFLSPGPAIAQSISQNMPPAVGMGATSPLPAGSARAGRHSARFDRDRNARHQSGRSFAERGNDDLRRLRRRRTFRSLVRRRRTGRQHLALLRRQPAYFVAPSLAFVDRTRRNSTGRNRTRQCRHQPGYACDQSRSVEQRKSDDYPRQSLKPCFAEETGP